MVFSEFLRRKVFVQQSDLKKEALKLFLLNTLRKIEEASVAHI